VSGRGGGFGRAGMSAGAATGRGRGGGGGGGPFAGPSRDFVPVPKERRGATMRRIVAFFRPYRGQVAVVLVAILVTSLLGVVNPYLLKLLIDNVIIGQQYDLLGPYVALMIVIPIVTGLIGVGQSYLSNVVGQRVMQDLRNALYVHLQRMPLRFFTETRTGEIQSRLANDVGGVQSVVTDTASSVTANLATVVSTVIAMILIDWRLTVLSLGLTPLFLFLTYRVGRIRREVSKETQEALAEMSAATEETLSVSGILLSKTFGQQAAATARFARLNRDLARLQIRQAMVGRWFFMIIGTIFSILPAFVYWLAGTLAANGDPGAPTAGDIVAFTTLQSRLFFPLGQLLNVQVEIQGALALFDRIFEYLDMDPEIVDAPDAVDLDAGGVRGRVRFRDVWFRYPASAGRLAVLGAGIVGDAATGSVGGGDDEDAAVDEALDIELALDGADPMPAVEALLEEDALAEAEAAAADDGGNGASERRLAAASGAGVVDVVPDPAVSGLVSSGPARAPFALEGIEFVAEPGELVALVGPSGAGKTTTTYLIPRLYDADQGAVELDDTDVRKVTLASIGRAIGFVTQETYLFHATIRENLAYAKPGATERELKAAARLAAIHDRIRDLPEGYDTVVGERGYKLSGGEKQRIALARVLLKDPRILILDEATSALDTVSERLIQRAVETTMRGRTTLAIAHRLSTILRADLILVYERGRIVERGTHAELLSVGGAYARLYHEQFEPTADGDAAVRPGVHART
jgi:ATP-binding cassette subfamily B protein